MTIEVNGKTYPQVHLLKMSRQVKGLLTIIRNKDSPRLIRLVIEEGLSYLPYERTDVTTPTGEKFEGIKFSSKICGVSMVRAGESMENGLRQVCRKIRIGKILIQRNEEGVPQFIYSKLPRDIENRKIFLLDPLLATGGSVSEAIRVLLEHGVNEEDIIFLNLIAAPEGIEHLTKKYGKITIVSAEVDEKLSEHGICLPGVGDFGDRYFGTDDENVA